MKKSLGYESRMDRIFTEGYLWKHRTLRTIFDRPSSEWSHTTIDQKIKILKKIVASGEKLHMLIADYKIRYLEQNRRDIAIEAETALAILLEYQLQTEIAKESVQES
jgi:hypothetical protein